MSDKNISNAESHGGSASAAAPEAGNKNQEKINKDNADLDADKEDLKSQLTEALDGIDSLKRTNKRIAKDLEKAKDLRDTESSRIRSLEKTLSNHTEETNRSKVIELLEGNKWEDAISLLTSNKDQEVVKVRESAKIDLDAKQTEISALNKRLEVNVKRREIEAIAGKHDAFNVEDIYLRVGDLVQVDFDDKHQPSFSVDGYHDGLEKFIGAMKGEEPTRHLFKSEKRLGTGDDGKPQKPGQSSSGNAREETSELSTAELKDKADADPNFAKQWLDNM